jgi:hypothetical protein
VLAIFRTNQLITNILLLFYTAVLLSAPILQGRIWQVSPSGIGYIWLTHFFQGNNTIAWVAGIVAIGFGAFLVNYLDQAFRLSREISMIPGLAYVLLCCSIPQAGFISPIHLANIFLILALYEVMDTFKRNTVADRLFNAGFFLALASFFYPVYLVFILLLFRGLNMLRGFVFRERLMIVIGVLSTYFLLGVLSFMFDQYELFRRLQFSEAFGLFKWSNEIVYFGSLLMWLVWLIVLLVALSKQNAFMLKRVIQSQRRINLLYWGPLIAILTLPFQVQLSTAHLLIMAAPLGLLSGMNLQEMNRRWADLLHLIWLALILVFQFRDFIFPA